MKTSKTWETAPRRHFVNQPAEALYDMENDPAEARNLIDEPSLAATVQEMRKKLMDFRIQTKDPWLEQSFQEGEPGARVR